MFIHNKRLQYTVPRQQTNPGLTNLILERFDGPQGELAAAIHYFTQALSENNPGRKDMLLDIATEELAKDHLEIIGSLVSMLNKGAKGRLAEAAQEQAEMYRAIAAGGARQPSDAGALWCRHPAGELRGRALDGGLYRHHRRTHGGPTLQYRRGGARQGQSTSG